MIEFKRIQKLPKLPKSKVPWQLTGWRDCILAANPEHKPRILTKGMFGRWKWEVIEVSEINLDDPTLVAFQAANRRRGLLSLCRPRLVDKTLAGK